MKQSNLKQASTKGLRVGRGTKNVTFEVKLTPIKAQDTLTLRDVEDIIDSISKHWPSKFRYKLRSIYK